MKQSCLILTAVLALAGCGIDPSEDPTFSSSDELSRGNDTGASADPAKSGGTTSDPVQACFADSQGGPTSCKPLATWKQYAIDTCAAKGMEVSRIDYADSCGNDLTRYVKFECCPRPPPPPPPPPACFTDSQGDATSCKPSATWKQYASDVCTRKGTVLTRIDYADSCGNDLYRFTKYECCPSSPPPPPPPTCFAGVVDHKPVCVADEKLKIEASEICAAKRQTLVSISYLNDTCANAGPLPVHMAAEFKCCP